MPDIAHFLFLRSKGIRLINNIINISRHFLFVKILFNIRNGKADHLNLLVIHDNRRHLRQFIQFHPDVLTNLKTLTFKTVLDADKVFHVFSDTLFLYTDQGNGFLNFLHHSACRFCILRKAEMFTKFCRQTFCT